MNDGTLVVPPPHAIDQWLREVKMSKYLPGAIGVVVLLIASTALAQERMALESASVGNARADCSGATTDGVVEASARIQFDAEAQRIINDEKVWGRNPFQKAAEGEFGGVKSDSNAIANSVLNREAMSRIPFPTIWPIVSRFGDWKQVRGTGGIGWSPAAPGEGELLHPKKQKLPTLGLLLSPQILVAIKQLRIRISLI